MRAQWVCSRERRIALYKRSSISHQSWRWLQRRDWSWVVADHADSSHKTGSRGGRSSSTKSTTVVTSTTTTTNNTEATTGPAMTEVEAGRLQARPTPLPSPLPRDFGFSPVVSIRISPVGWEHIAPPSHTAAASLHLGFTPRFQDHTNTTSATHSEQIDKQHSDPLCSWQAIRVQHVQAVSTANTSRPIGVSPSDLGPSLLAVHGQPERKLL